MICRNGHEIEARVKRSDGWSVCPVCLSKSNKRRSRRYLEKHREERRAKQRQRYLEKKLYG